MPETPPENPTQFPMPRTLSNSKGKAIEGEVLAKAGEIIAFQRTADGGTFLISISQLSIDDQLFLGNLEDEGRETIEAMSAKVDSSDESGLSAQAGGGAHRPLIAREIAWHLDTESALKACIVSKRNLMLVISGNLNLSPGEFEVDLFSERSEQSSDSLKRTVLKDTSFLGFVNNTFEAVHLECLYSEEFNAEQQEKTDEIVEQWQLKTLPTILIINPEGQEVARVEGYDRRGPNLLRERLKAMLD